MAALLLTAPGIGAQVPDTGSIGVLLRAPKSREGIAGLGANVLPCLVASYGFDGAAIEVFYTAAAIPPSSSWPAAPCAALQLRHLPAASNGPASEADREFLAYSDPRGWKILFAFPRGFPQANACDFAGRFVSRFQSFLSITGSDPRASFPAVLMP